MRYNLNKSKFLFHIQISFKIQLKNTAFDLIITLNIHNLLIKS